MLFVITAIILNNGVINKSNNTVYENKWVEMFGYNLSMWGEKGSNAFYRSPRHFLSIHRIKICILSIYSHIKARAFASTISDVMFFTLSPSESTFRFLNTESKCRRHEVSIRLIDSCDSFRHQTRTFSCIFPKSKTKMYEFGFRKEKVGNFLDTRINTGIVWVYLEPSKPEANTNQWTVEGNANTPPKMFDISYVLSRALRFSLFFHQIFVVVSGNIANFWLFLRVTGFSTSQRLRIPIV